MNRPFPGAVLERARRIASQYRLTFQRDDDVGFVGASVEMPYVMADGRTVQECAATTFEALTAAVATLLERGERPPAPASEGKRDMQLNVRLSADEKMTLEAAAQRAGFRSVSDYVRFAALAKAG